MDITTTELELICALLEQAMDIGLWDEHGVLLYTDKECAELWMKLAALEDRADSLIAKEQKERDRLVDFLLTQGAEAGSDSSLVDLNTSMTEDLIDEIADKDELQAWDAFVANNMRDI